jgi:glycogen phosphorylase
MPGRSSVIDVEGDVRAADLGESRDVTATIRLGRLGTEDISVQLAHGRVGANGELVDPDVIEMAADHCTDGTCSYRGTFTSRSPGLYGFSVRVVPSHSDLTNQMDLGLVVWA